MKNLLRWAVSIVIITTGFSLPAVALNIDKEALKTNLESLEITLPFPNDFERWPEQILTKPQNTTSKSSAKNPKTIHYRTVVWGNVMADLSDFRTKVRETLNDPRGWIRAGLKFIEVDGGQDLDVILSDPASLEALPGCSGELSCTTWSNQVIINDVRWREGTAASRAGGMSTRDYQHMVLNHEMGHWLGHYSHIDGCTAENGFAGGPAPIMVQQSTGLRGCTSFNAWPLDAELWTLK